MPVALCDRSLKLDREQIDGLSYRGQCIQRQVDRSRALIRDPFGLLQGLARPADDFFAVLRDLIQTLEDILLRVQLLRRLADCARRLAIDRPEIFGHGQDRFIQNLGHRLRGHRNKGLIDLLLDRRGSGVRDLRRDGVLFFIYKIFDLRRVDIAGQYTDHALAEILRDHDRRVVISGLHAVDRALAVGKGPAQSVVFF